MEATYGPPQIPCEHRFRGTAAHRGNRPVPHRCATQPALDKGDGTPPVGTFTVEARTKFRDAPAMLIPKKFRRLGFWMNAGLGIAVPF